MTIAVGLLCNNGADLVIASDRQFTVEGIHKRFARKLASPRFDLVYAFSGDPGLYAEARQKLSGFLDDIKPADMSVDLIQKTAEGVLTQMGLRGSDVVYPRLQLLIGYCDDTSHLLVFNGHGVYETESGIEIVGCGDTSLIDFLTDNLYSKTLSSEQGAALAAYLVKKATQYVDKVGGPVDVSRGCWLGFEMVSDNEIKNAISKIESQEEFLSTLLVRTPFQKI